VVSWPAPRSDTHVAGIGDTTFTAFLSPAKAKGFIWGVGPAFLFPTASSSELGDGKWGLGPSIVVLYMHKSIVAGALINNIWSYAGWGADNVNAMTLQPFFNYNFPGGWARDGREDDWQGLAMIYSNQTRSMLQTDQQFPSVSGQTKGLLVNADGSVDVYLGPKAPPGRENNWVQSVPREGYSVALRLYGPLDPWFDKTWRPGEIEPVE
jgi:Protein of unknown function (DUF1214)